ncbi:MAG: 50S ribosomal protein L11 methyltransferase [Defluviitaleaceae bacterium]|nr:50S ribosomal protein L11 methyltransferase [Defluviitaleaceae bacterium]
MEWIKAAIKTTTVGTEAVTGILIQSGITGMEIIDPQDRVRHLTEGVRTWDYADESLLTASSEEARVIFYVTKDTGGESILGLVRRKLASLKRDAKSPNAEPTDGAALELGSLELLLESANDESWLNEWKKHFKPLRVGGVTIVPEWEDYTPATGETVFRIDPGTAFGTGQHQTTKLCVMALQEFLRPGDRLLDIGCGSGILSVIGLLLGADSVFACDIDPAGAISATRKNAALNSVDINRLEIHAGDAISDSGLREKIIERKFDVIVANIVADVIIELLPLFKLALKPDGIFVASGIIGERLGDVLAAIDNENFNLFAKISLEGWLCVVGKPHA